MMKKIGMLVVFVLLLAVATTVQAEIKAGSFSVTPFIGTYIFEGNEYDFRNTYAAGLRAGYNFTKNIGVEGVLSYVPTEIKNMTGNDEVELFGYGIEGLYHFMPESRFVPFLAVGIGEIHYNAPAGDSGNMNKFYIDYGAGLKIFVTDSIALRADVRHVLPTNDNYNDFLGTVGITFAFGGEKKVAEPKLEEPPPPVVILDSDKDGVPDNLDKCPGTPAGVVVDKDGCPVDSDKDGVADYLDKCPGTPAGVVVDKDGCPVDSDKDGVADYLDKCPGTPVGVVVDKDGCPVDSDKDGVADYLDKCPGTPAGVVVDKDGCPVDSDKDGVADYLDKCPNTPAGATVDKDGCVHEKISISLNVEFDTNKFDIKKRYHVDIKKVSDFMKAHPETNAVIEGHTDNVGTAESNMKLSQNRAESVRKYLIDKLGIDPATITAVGYGKTRPIAGNDTPEGRQKNRRVEAVIETVQIK
jgi:OOP family OmpA-OmpF porin